MPKETIQEKKPDAADNKKIVEKLRKDFQSLWSDQCTWREHALQIAEYLDPYSGRNLSGDNPDDEDNGRRKDSKRINSTPAQALDVFVSGLSEGLTPATRPWFKLRIEDDELNENQAVQEWLYLVENAILSMMEVNGFYKASKTIYRELGAFGTAQMFISDHPTNVSHCKAFTFGQFVLALDAYDKISTSYTKLRLTVEQIVKEYGDKNLPEVIKQNLRDGKVNTKYTVIHAVMPNDYFNPQKLGIEGMEYKSIHFWETATYGDEPLRVSGFYTKPMVTPRGRVDGASVYGRSQAMEALGDIKMLQKLEKDKLNAIDVHLSPPVLAPDSMRPVGLKTFPKAINYYPAGVQPEGIRPVFEIDFDINAAIQEIANVQQRIKQMFFFDVFLAIMSTDKQATAFEIAKRYEEKIMMIGPILDNLKSEYLSPAIDRHFDILMQKRLLPDIPPEIQGVEIKVEYTSVLAAAQKMVGASTYEQAMGFIGRLAEVNPTVLDLVDLDKVATDYLTMIGMPPTVIRKDKDVKAMRDQRAQAQQAMEQSAMMKEVAASAKTASETPMGDSNMLEQIVGNNE